MAIYHFSVSSISRKSGRSVVASAAYISRSKLKDYVGWKYKNYTLYLVDKLDLIRCKELKKEVRNAIILTNDNNAYFFENGKLVKDVNQKLAIAKNIDRQRIKEVRAMQRKANPAVHVAKIIQQAIVNCSQQYRIKDYSCRKEVAYSAIFAPLGTPDWVYISEKLWNEVERVEKRVDAMLARSIIVALPSELSIEQNIEIVRKYADYELAKGLVVQVSVHYDHPLNPHAHFMVLTRAVLPQVGEYGEKFSLKRRDVQTADQLKADRKNWEVIINKVLKEAGCQDRVDCRSLKERGAGTNPNIHLGPQIPKDLAEIRHWAARGNKQCQRYLEISRDNGLKIAAKPEIGLKLITHKKAVFGFNELFDIARRHSSSSEQFYEVFERMRTHATLKTLLSTVQEWHRLFTPLFLSHSKAFLASLSLQKKIEDKKIIQISMYQ